MPSSRITITHKLQDFRAFFRMGARLLMIVARILPHAGLGNQMFMYAAGLALSQRLGTELTIGAWDFETNQDEPEKRPYHLSEFPEITERMPTSRELLKICPAQILINLLCYKKIKRSSIFRRLIRKILNKAMLRHILSRVYFQEGEGYCPDFVNVPDDTMIIGCWESEKYFADVSGLVRKKFTFPSSCFSPELSAKVSGCNSVAIHVRRGDKLHTPLHLPSTEGYVRLALAKISALTDSPAFFVFSDDIAWCMENLPKIHEAEYTFVEGQTPLQDMALMTQCRHVIMGPSTFSWWGAWLNTNPGKIVIAPDVSLWYKKVADGRKDLLPPEWITLQ